MKNLIAKTKSGLELEVSIEIKPSFRIQSKAQFKGKEYMTELSHAKRDGVYIPTIHFGEHSVFLKENFPGVKGDVHIVLSQDWEPVVEQMKKEQEEIWKKEAIDLPVPGILNLKYHSYHKWSILNSEIPHYLIQYHPMLSNINELNHKDYEPTMSDYDDYNSWDLYTISYEQIKADIAHNLGIRKQEQIRINHRKAMEEKAKQEQHDKMYANVVSVQKGKVKESRGSDGDDLEQDITITMKSGKSYRFCARNIFDFGYVLNPSYLPGGGLLMNIESFIENNPANFNTNEKKEQYRSEHPTETGWIWSRYDQPSVQVAQEELEAALVAKYETRGMQGIRM